MTRVTEGHLARHYQGVRGGRDAALLDIAQDHVLYLLHQAGAFDAGLVFKGGTALRKFRAGSAGRFSTDLDFAAPSEELALSVLAALDGVEIDGFSFAISNLGDDGRRGDLVVETPFGHPQLGAKVELARHALSLPARQLADGLFNLGGDAAMRVIDMAELIAARCEPVLGVRVPVRRATPRQDERSDELLFSCAKLQGTGFTLMRNHAAEIDATLRLCAAAFGAADLRARA